MLFLLALVFSEITALPLREQVQVFRYELNASPPLVSISLPINLVGSVTITEADFSANVFVLRLDLPPASVVKVPRGSSICKPNDSVWADVGRFYSFQMRQNNKLYNISIRWAIESDSAGFKQTVLYIYVEPQKKR